MDVVHDAPHDYTLNPSVRGNHFSLGGTWTVGEEYATTGPNAQLALNFYAADAHLVLAGEGTVTVDMAGDPSAHKVITVSGEPDLYTLYSGEPTSGVLTLTFSEGLQAYAFTFG
jgi:hypothetical protein